MEIIQFSRTLLRKTFVLLILLSFAAGSQAEVFKCVDKATGKMTFTDKACSNDQPGVYHPVGSTNSDSGYDSQATSKVMQRGASDAAKFQDGWQTQNAESVSKQEWKERSREYRRSQVVDRDSIDLNKGQNQQLSNDIYQDRTKDSDSHRVYEKK